MHSASASAAAAGGGAVPPAYPYGNAASLSASATPLGSSGAGSSAAAARNRRVIMHCDMDCFYAQVERERFPHWRGAPIGVVQNGTLTVTTNYRVRARGWKKMGAPEGMAAALPSMRFGGSNMVRYRAASKAWYQVFQSFPGVVVMKKSIDESYADLTQACLQRIREGHLLRAVLQSSSERARIASLASARYDAAEKSWRADDALMLSKGVAPQDLESTGSLRSAQSFSRSTDPISELRRQAEREKQANADKLQTIPSERDDQHSATAASNGGGGGGGSSSSSGGEARANGTNALAPNAAELEHLTIAQVEELCNKIHPLDHCRADKRLPPIMLQPLSSEPVPPEQRLPGVETAPWREMFVGYVFLDGTDTKKKTTAAVGAASSGAAAEAEDTEEADALLSGMQAPPSSFADEDPLNPSHDLLLAVGSQIAFEMRLKLFETLGFTTSAAVAPNCMLAKVASSLNKPNQQSVVRSGSVARAFLAPIKLKAISGFGPKAEEQAEEKGLSTVGDVQKLSPQALGRLFPASDKFASYLADIAAGVDDTPVLVHAAPKSIGQSKRQRTFNTAQRISLLDWLCARLQERVFDDEREFARRATSFTFSWITTTDWTSVSRRAPLPPHKGEHRTDGLPPHHEMLELAVRMCRAHLPDSLALRCLALSVSNFVPLQGGKRLEAFFGSAAAATPPSSHTGDSGAAAAIASAQQQQSQKDRTSSSSPSIASFFSLPPSPSTSVTPPSAAAASSTFKSPVVPAGDTPAAAAALMDDDEMPSLEVAPPPAAALAANLLDNMAGVARARREELRRESQAMDAADAAAAGIIVPAPTSAAAADSTAAGQDTELSQQEKDEIEALFGGSQPIHAAALEAPTLASSDDAGTAAAAAQTQHLCSECGQTVPDGPQWVEHTDRHFAARFQAELREADRRQREKEQQAAAAAAAAVSGAQRSGGKRKGKSSAAAAASSGVGSMSLTRFLVAQPPPSISPEPTHGAAAAPHAHLPGPSKRAQAPQPAAAAAAASQSLKRFFAQPPPPPPST